MRVQISLQIVILFPLGIYPELGLLGHMVVAILIFFFSIFNTVFHSGYINLHSHSWYTRVPSPSHPHQLLSFFFLVSHFNKCEVIFLKKQSSPRQGLFLLLFFFAHHQVESWLSMPEFGRKELF